jgi:hypothetical protein
VGLEGDLALLIFLNVIQVHVEEVRGIERASFRLRVKLC